MSVKNEIRTSDVASGLCRYSRPSSRDEGAAIQTSPSDSWIAAALRASQRRWRGRRFFRVMCITTHPCVLASESRRRVDLEAATRADVAKSVDARDLKSLGESCAGSSPAVRTNIFPYKSNGFRATGRLAGPARLGLPLKFSCRDEPFCHIVSRKGEDEWVRSRSSRHPSSHVPARFRSVSSNAFYRPRLRTCQRRKDIRVATALSRPAQRAHRRPSRAAHDEMKRGTVSRFRDDLHSRGKL
jgi:hypothetical protein